MIYNKYFMKQKMMHPVMYALLPIALVAIFLWANSVSFIFAEHNCRMRR